MKNRRKLGISAPVLIKNIRVVILGKDGVGKSALTVRFITKRFIGEYDKTLENTYRHPLQVNNDIITLDITDTAGINSQGKLDHCASLGDIFVVLYSIADRSSFLEATWIAKHLKSRVDLDPSTLIITATKRDLEHFRQIKITEGNELTRQLDCGFYEITISEGFNDTLDMFHNIIRQYLETHDTDELASTSSPPSPSSLSPSSPKAEKNPWSKVKGLRTIPFRKKSTLQTV